jgi:predicted GNAT family acetyltransferase
MDIREEDERLVLYDDADKLIGEISWLKTGNVLVINHTFVESEFNGKGYGRQLVNAVAGKARAENLELLPICPYAKRVLIEPDYEDLLKK